MNFWLTCQWYTKKSPPPILSNNPLPFISFHTFAIQWGTSTKGVWGGGTGSVFRKSSQSFLIFRLDSMDVCFLRLKMVAHIKISTWSALPPPLPRNKSTKQKGNASSDPVLLAPLNSPNYLSEISSLLPVLYFWHMLPITPWTGSLWVSILTSDLTQISKKDKKIS